MDSGIDGLLSTIGDCFDEMHARRTGQRMTSGEPSEHRLDAIVVPLAAAGIARASEIAA